VPEYAQSWYEYSNEEKHANVPSGKQIDYLLHLVADGLNYLSIIMATYATYMNSG
jgi:hypothetical protein